MQSIPDLWLSFRGRASRRDLWLRFALPGVVLLLVVQTVDTLLKANGFLSNAAQLALAWPAFALGVKRFHDRGRHGRPVVFLGLAMLALALVATIASYNIAFAAGAHMAPPSLYVGVQFAASLGMAGLLVYLVIAVGLREGQQGANRYGPDPLHAG